MVKRVVVMTTDATTTPELVSTVLKTMFTSVGSYDARQAADIVRARSIGLKLFIIPFHQFDRTAVLSFCGIAEPKVSGPIPRQATASSTQIPLRLFARVSPEVLPSIAPGSEFFIAALKRAWVWLFARVSPDMVITGA